MEFTDYLILIKSMNNWRETIIIKSLELMELVFITDHWLEVAYTVGRVYGLKYFAKSHILFIDWMKKVY